MLPVPSTTSSERYRTRNPADRDEPESTIADCQVRSFGETALLQRGEKRCPGEFAFPVAIEDGDQLLGAVFEGHQSE